MKIIRSTDKNKTEKRMYGYDMNIPKTHVSTNFEFPMRRMPYHEISEIKIEKNKEDFDTIKILYVDGDKINEILRESSYKRNENEIKRENLMLSTYKEITKLNHVKTIKCIDFLDEIKNRLKSDVRYVYKKISLESLRNTRHSVYIYKIYTVIIATLSIYNEIDFKQSIKLSLISKDNIVTLKIEMRLKENGKDLSKNAKGSINESREIYLEALCKNKGSFELIGRTLCLTYIIEEAPKDEYKLYSRESEEEMFFAKWMHIFNPIDIEIEEAEEL